MRSEVGGRRSEVGGRRSEVGGRRSEVGGRRSEVGQRRCSDLRPLTSDLYLSAMTRTFAATLLFLAAACSPGRAQRPADAPHLTDSAFGGRLWVPNGVKVAQFAKVDKGRFLALGPDGAVYVSQPQANQITRL